MVPHRRLSLQNKLTLAATAVGLAAVWQRMTGFESPFWGNVLLAVAGALVVAAIFGNRIEGLWRSWRLRGIRLKQWAFPDNPTEAHVFPDRRVRGLLLTCHPESVVIPRPKARVEQKNAEGQVRSVDVLAAARGNRVLVWASSVDSDTGELLQTKVIVRLAVGVHVVSAEPMTRRISREFTTDRQ